MGGSLSTSARWGGDREDDEGCAISLFGVVSIKMRSSVLVYTVYTSSSTDLYIYIMYRSVVPTRK